MAPGRVRIREPLAGLRGTGLGHGMLNWSGKVRLDKF